VNESIPKASRTSKQPMKTWTLAEFTGSHCKIWKSTKAVGWKYKVV